MENNETYNLLNDAADFIAKKDFTNAKNTLEKAYALEPNNAEILKNLGLCHINLQDYIQALDVFEKLIRQNPDDGGSWFYLANTKDKLSDTDGAIKAYKKVIELRKEFYDAYKSLGVLYIKEGRYEDVLSLILPVLESVCDDYLFYYFVSTSLMSLGRHSEAIFYLEKAVELMPEHVQLLNNLGNCNIAAAKFDEAQKYLDRAYAINPQNGLTNFNLGTLYQVKRDYKKALGYFEEAYKLEPSTTTLSTLALCAYQGKEYELAKNLYKNLTALHPEKMNFQNNLMNCYIQLDEVKEAYKIAEQLVKMNPKSGDLLKKYAYLARLNRFYSKAQEILETLIKRGKVDVDIYYNYALTFVGLGDLESAKEAFKKALILDPKNAMVHMDLGILYLKMNLIDWAQDELKIALDLDPYNPEVVFSYAAYLNSVNEFAESEKYYEKLCEFAPDTVEYKNFRAQNLISGAEFEKALEILKDALSSAPENAGIKFSLAKIYFHQKKYKVAKEMLEDIAGSPNNTEILNLLAKTYMKLKHYEPAAGIFENLSKEFSQNHILLTDLGQCYLKMQEYEKAKNAAQKALAIFPDFEDAIKILKEVDLKND